MRIDYRFENFAPKGDALHEKLVKYAEAYLHYNIDAPEEYIHHDVQYGDEKRGIRIADVALIPDGSYKDHQYNSIAIECGNLTGEAVEHLTYTAEFFDVVGWIPYPFWHKLDKYQDNRLDIRQELECRGTLLGIADIIHLLNLERRGSGFIVPVSDTYYCCSFDADFGSLKDPVVYVYLISNSKDIVEKHEAFGLFPFGTRSLPVKKKGEVGVNL